MLKSNRNAETHISVDPTRNELVFRYIELLPFEDTLFYRKQHIDKVKPGEFNEENYSYGNNDNINNNNNDNYNGYEGNNEMMGNNDYQGGFDGQNQGQFDENENDGF